MKKILLFIVILLTSCEKYVTNISTLTLSGEYVVEKIAIVDSQRYLDTVATYDSGQVFIQNSFPDPFDTIVINKFKIHFDYSSVMIYRDSTGWRYGVPPNNIFYNRIPWTHDAYVFGKIEFGYLPKNRNNKTRMVFRVENDLFESAVLSGLMFEESNKKYYAVLYLNRIGP